ncbi:MAG: PilT domain protein [Acidobacteria bacterium]|nr:PilT domain protein [Acidobacteriota bacterium]
MSRYCIDTSAYSHFKLGDPRIVDMLDRADWIGVSSIVLGELWTGFLQGERALQNEAEFREFLANPVVETLGMDGEVARIYAEIVTDLRRAGTPIPTNDIWIAAAAARAGATVLTYDLHFRSVPRVGCLILPIPGGN